MSSKSSANPRIRSSANRRCTKQAARASIGTSPSSQTKDASTKLNMPSKRSPPPTSPLWAYEEKTARLSYHRRKYRYVRRLGEED
ncbi:hypothetical protein LTR10_001048 [Elasticomyces elasticus]|nr:hypothetical protein LTR10_001048 [Elasticomyces elasticus]